MIIHQIPITEAQPLSLRTVNEDLLEFYLPFITRTLTLDIPISENLHIKLEPYYGIVFGEEDVLGQSFILNVDYGSSEPVSLYIPNNLLNLILGNFLNPLLPEHFDNTFLCNILEIILIEPLNALREKTGIIPKLSVPTAPQDGIQSSWRLYINDDMQIFYPLLMVGEQKIMVDLLKKLFSQATHNKAVVPLVDLKIISIVRKMSMSQIRNLKIGEIIILFTKRHPINEPIVIIGNKIVCHTVLHDTELQLTQDPQHIYDIEELRMTMHEDEAYAAQEQHHEEEMIADAHQHAYHANPIKEALSDLKVTVTFELSRMEMSTNAVSHLKEGGIINLQKQITEDVYLTIAGRTIAVGEVVQVGRNFGVLIKEVL